MLEIEDNAKNIEDVHLKSKLLTLENDSGEIVIDIQALLKAPAGSEEAYFRITGLAEKFGKETKEFKKLPSVIEYIAI